MRPGARACYLYRVSFYSPVLCGVWCAADTKGWGSSITRHTNTARLAEQRGLSAAAPPSMSLMLLAEAEDATAAAAAAAPDLPVSPEQQESIISVLSVVSSALLLIIIGGAGEGGHGKLKIALICCTFLYCRSATCRCLGRLCFGACGWISGRPAPQSSFGRNSPPTPPSLKKTAAAFGKAGRGASFVPSGKLAKVTKITQDKSVIVRGMFC